ncbi:terminase large subunit [Planktotalea sp.]|uniref:terminase large subunit n=1 Tax=Planktotalea sp. TaxID=2029877 RepID=UPI003D6A7217
MPFDFDLSCPDWFDKLQAGETPLPNVPIDETKADLAEKVFNQLRLPDVKGQPRFGEVDAEWFTDILRTVYGCVDPDTKVRLINELFLLIPKKNSKTTNSAGLGLVALMLNEIPNARMIIAGPTQKVAETCFGQAQGMIDADPKLQKFLKVQEHRSTIVNEVTGAKLEIKTFDMAVVTGVIPVFVILDELHLMSSKAYATKVIGQLRGGLIKEGSLLVIITTQSAEEPAGVFRSELNHARAIRDGSIPAEGQLVVLYEFPEAFQTDKSKPFLNTDCWHLVLPNLDKSVTLDWLKREFRKVSAKGAEDLQLWLSQHLNIQIGLGLHSDRWVGADWWLDQAREGLSLETIMEECDVCTVGIDGGGLDDLLGLAVIGRHKETRDWLHWSRAWVQKDVLTERKEIAERLQDFDNDGDLIILDDVGSDTEEVAEICAMLNERGLLSDDIAIGLDPEGVADIVDALASEGLSDDQVRPVSQGYKLNAAINGLPRKLKRGTFWHCGQPLMSWCVGNAKTEQRGNARMVTKQRSGVAKIDPLMATFNAVMLMSLNPVASTKGAASVLLEMDEVVV